MNQIFLRVQDMDSKISSAAVKAYDLSKLRENPKRSRIGGVEYLEANLPISPKLRLERICNYSFAPLIST
jgi:hypothetical protein